MMQLSGDILHEYFSEVNVIREKKYLNVTCYVDAKQLPGMLQEGWKTAICLDASYSMKSFYGLGLGKKETLPNKTLDQNVQREPIIGLAQRIGKYFSSEIDQDYETQFIFSSCGKDGQDIEDAGTIKMDRFNKEQVNILRIKPPEAGFIAKQKLKPALIFLDKKFNKAKKRIFIFLSDSKISDLNELKSYSINLGLANSTRERSLTKLIFVGVGTEINKETINKLLSFNKALPQDKEQPGTEWIWDYKIAENVKNESSFIAKLIDESFVDLDYIGIIQNEKGKSVKSFRDGVPLKFDFKLDLNDKYFTLKLRKINKDVNENRIIEIQQFISI